MAMEPLILVVNPGSASRKYALFADEHEQARLHFEHDASGIICTLQTGQKHANVPVDIENLDQAAAQVQFILQDQQILRGNAQIHRIALRVVAPSSYFLENRIVTDEVIHQLQALEAHAPLHIHATLQELYILREQFPNIPIVGVSDSAFHISKPDYAWNYGLPLDDADRFDIKRFGYHGLSVASAIHTLRQAHKLTPKVVICHIGSGVSVTAVQGGRSLDTTMGYSPLEGVVMATRSGSIDFGAAKVLRHALGLDEVGMETYLNKQSGLLGLGGTPDVRELIRREGEGDHRAHLALETFIFSIQKAIGQMTAALGGTDLLGFTGTVGERSAPIRKRILERLHYLDLILDKKTNDLCAEPTELTLISRLTQSKPIFVVPANEEREMVQTALTTF